jgi:ribose transport system ATP-binding protein
MNTYALHLEGIGKSFVSVAVLHDVTLNIEPGEIYGLVGENGAGKSTLMNIIGGVFRKDAGKMKVFGESYEPVEPNDAVKAGIAFVHQELNLFTNLTVAENFFIEEFPKTFLGAINYKKMRKIAEEKISYYGLPVEPDARIDALPGGVRQMIEIIKALMKSPRILIFDEPTTSLSFKEKEKLFSTIKNLKQSGITIIYISHILDDIFTLCGRVSVIRDGRIISTDRTETIDKNNLIKKMVGREMSQIYPAVNKSISGKIMLETKDVVSEDGRIKNISIQVYEGEIIGIYGLMGAGRTEFLRTIYGINKIKSGGIRIKLKRIENPSPVKCIQEGVAFVTEDRHEEGLLLPKSIAVNLSLATLPSLSGKAGIVDRKREIALIGKTIKDLRIKAANHSQTAESLSGGNQQKVVFGKWVMNKPDIVFLDEPTRGVDVGAKFEIYNIIVNMAEKGAAVIFVSSEMEELIGLCDRILVMKDGSIKGQLEKNSFSQEAIINLAL